MRDRRCAARVIAKKDTNGALQAFALQDEVIDVAFFFENASNLEFQFRSRDIRARVLGRNRIADSRQHIGDRISHLTTPFSIADCRLPIEIQSGNRQLEIAMTLPTRLNDAGYLPLERQL